jgi:hypothetical protein
MLQLSSLNSTQLSSQFLFDRQSNIYSKINSLKTILSNQYQELQYLQSSLELSSTAVLSKYTNSIESHSIKSNLDIISSNVCYENDIEIESELNLSCLEPSFQTSLSTPPSTPFTPQSKSSSSSLSYHDNESGIGFPSDIFYFNCYNSN